MSEESRDRLSEKAEAAAKIIHENQKDHDQYLVIAADREEVSVNTGIAPKEAAACFYVLAQSAPHLAAAIMGGIISYVRDNYDGDPDDFMGIMSDGPETTQ